MSDRPEAPNLADPNHLRVLAAAIESAVEDGAPDPATLAVFVATLARAVAQLAEQIGRPPAWLVETEDGWRIVDRD